jgi:hypothetical protein
MFQSTTIIGELVLCLVEVTNMFFFFSSGPGAYAPDALQPVGLLCNLVNPPTACLDVPTVAARCLHVFLNVRDTSSERWNLWAGMLSETFAWMPTSTLHSGIFYMLDIYDMGPTGSLPLRRKARWGFSALKNPDSFGRVWTRELGYLKEAHNP